MPLLFEEFEAVEPDGAPHNIYFAVRPDERAAEALCRLGRAAGRMMDPSRLHLSIYSLGMHARLPEQQLAKAIEHARRVRQRPFVLELDRMGAWGRGRGPLPVVAWADDGVGGLRDLHERLHEAMATTAPWRRRKPGIEPHLTLWRAEGQTPLSFIAPIRWWVREFVLLDSRYGQGRHDVLDRFPLVG